MGSKWQLVTHAIHDEVDDLILCDGTHKVMTTHILLIFIWVWPEVASDLFSYLIHRCWIFSFQLH